MLEHLGKNGLYAKPEKMCIWLHHHQFPGLCHLTQRDQYGSTKSFHHYGLGLTEDHPWCPGLPVIHWLVLEFIKEFSQVVVPVTQHFCKNSTCIWTLAAQQAFDQLKKAFTFAAILRHLDPSKHLVVKTAASSCAMGGNTVAAAEVTEHSTPMHILLQKAKCHGMELRKLWQRAASHQDCFWGVASPLGWHTFSHPGIHRPQ